MPFGDHLRADEDIDVATRQAGQNLLHRMPSTRGIAVQAGDARLWEDATDLALDLLGTRPKIFHPRSPAAGTGLGGRGGELAVMALQHAIIDVEGQGYAAARTLTDIPAFMTLHERGIASSVQK